MPSRFQDSLKFIDGYTAEKIPFEEYRKLASRLKRQIGGENSQTFSAVRETTVEQRAWMRAVDENLYRLTLAIRAGDELIGLHYSQQSLEAEVLMKYTGIITAHRGRGVYTALLRELIEEFTELGFKAIRSQHMASNHAILRTKLQLGFLFSGFVCDPRHGWCVQLLRPLTPIGLQAMRFWQKRL